MPLEKTNTVDAIGIESHSDKVVLTIIDSHLWNDDEHLFLLQEKINTYLRFVESGELVQSYEKARNRNVAINILLKFLPDPKGNIFLQKAKEVVESAGIEFRYEHFPDDN